MKKTNIIGTGLLLLGLTALCGVAMERGVFFKADIIGAAYCGSTGSAGGGCTKSGEMKTGNCMYEDKFGELRPSASEQYCQSKSDMGVSDPKSSMSVENDSSPKCPGMLYECNSRTGKWRGDINDCTGTYKHAQYGGGADCPEEDES